MLRDFIVWHFVDMPRRLLRIWQGVLLFILHYFAISFHLRTFFKPWHRQSMHHGRGLDLKDLSSTLTFNAVGTIIGMLLRLSVIVAGSVTFAGVLVIGGGALIGWLLLPVASIFGIVWGIGNLL